MHELKKGLAFAVKGKLRKDVLAAMARQMKQWNLKMPKVQPLVLDFGLGRFYETGETEFWLANEAKAGYCAKFLFVFDGQTCPMHYHHRKHETFFIVRGKVRMRYGGKTRIMREGSVLPVATRNAHSFTGIGPALLLEVSMPCSLSDNYFEDRRIPIGGNCKPRKR